ncbi:MAG: HypC/HybG/HupF family hydrogenase formation chaperone [Planctomycetota bacterium]
MCLAVPGKIVKLNGQGEMQTGLVDFQGSQVEVSLALVPDAGIGDWVLVHAGLAITLLDESEAMETWRYLKEAGLTEMDTEIDKDNP